jgi:hypothetical protein
VICLLQYGLSRALSRTDPAEAQRLVDESGEAARRFGEIPLEGLSRMQGARLAFDAGDPERAEREARAARDLLGAIPTDRACATAWLARALVAQGKGGAALELAREAMAAVGTNEGFEAGESLVRLALVEALEGSGDREGARRELALAAERLRTRAERIGDVEWRTSFLENLEENAATLDRHQSSAQAHEPGTSSESQS